MFETLTHLPEAKAILDDWIGDGAVPVSRIQANTRASTCIECPKHHKEPWWNLEAKARDVVAIEIRRQIEFKNRLDLTLDREEEVSTCRACWCCMRLKCWTPLEHILAHLPAKTLTEFPSNCWIVAEAQQLHEAAQRKDPQ